MSRKKVVVGMSGGVDSSAAAYLLKEQGYDVIGVTMRMWQQDPAEEAGTEKVWGGSVVDDAGKVAETLGIPYYVLDFQEEFKDQVIDYFTGEYQSGRTPNPCVTCNRHIKWAALMKRAKELGADYIATGHYARIEQLDNGRYALKVAEVSGKDQTYALYNLTQEQLSHTLMPVGDYTKDEIREIARKAGLSVAAKPDSQDVCFIPDGDYAGFIERETGQKSPAGNFITADGTILGQHRGIIHYTVGQRKGLGLALGHPVFVVELRPDTNEVVIGEDEDIRSRYVRANRLNFMSVERPQDGMRVWAKIRYNHRGAWCTLTLTGEDEILCTFESSQRAITPGQSVVFYDGQDVLGGGTIIGDR